MVILKHPVTSPAPRVRPVVRLSDLRETNIMRLGPQAPPVQISPLPPKLKPICGPVPFPDFSCEQQTTCMDEQQPYFVGSLHKNLPVCKPLHPRADQAALTNDLLSQPGNTSPAREARTVRRPKPTYEMLRHPRNMPTRETLRFQYDQPRTMPTRPIATQKTPRPPLRTLPTQSLRESQLFMRSEEYDDESETTTKKRRIWKRSKSTRPPYPGGIKPDTEEIGMETFLCGGDVKCEKYVWTTKKQRSTKKSNSRNKWKV